MEQVRPMSMKRPSKPSSPLYRHLALLSYPGEICPAGSTPMAPPSSKASWLENSKSSFTPFSPPRPHPRSCQDSLILMLKFLLHVSSLFCFNHHCHRSAFIISWLRMVVLSVCLSLVLFFPSLLLPDLGPGLSVEGHWPHLLGAS